VTPEAQRIAIAEACGWTQIESCTCCDGVSRGYQPTPGAHKKHLPDYLNDLNAMHDAEKVLTNEQDLEYSEALEQVVKGRFVTNNAEDMRRLRSATPAQRAEAFLRTIGKWRECK
jgi:hypothetical protein